MKQTKIVCSISDRRCDVDFLRKLFFSGMNVVRMNTAHASPEGIKEIIRNTRAVSQQHSFNGSKITDVLYLGERQRMHTLSG